MARPKAFDQEKAMRNAMLLFWRKGYEASSVKDLEIATGLKTSSLYNAFGGKEQLFLQTLSYYGDFVITGRIKRYLLHGDPIQSIYDFFISCFNDLREGQEGMACLLVNASAELSTKNNNVRELVLRYDALLEQAFENCVDRAQQQNQLSLSRTSNVIASQLVITLKGLLLSSKAIRNNQHMIKECEKHLSYIIKESERAT